MSNAANSMRYCPDCRRAVVVFQFHGHGSRDTFCTQCARVLQPSECRTGVGCIDGCGHAGNLADATIPDPASADDTPSMRGASDNHTHGAEGSCLVLPRMRGAVDAAVASRGGAMQKMRGAVLATTIPYQGKAQSPEASDHRIHGAEDANLVLPRMRGVVGAAAPSRGGATVGAAASRGGTVPKMHGAVADADASHSIDDMAARLGLVVAVGDHAKEVFRKLEHAKALHRVGSKNRHALYAACIHVACRALGTPCTFKELASVTGDDVAIKDIVRLVKHVKTHVGEEDDGLQSAAGEMMGTVVRAGDYVRRFGSLVGIGDQEVNAALEAARRLEENLDVRRSPDSIAATLIYMAVQRAGAGKSFRDVSTAIGVSELTIKDVYRDLSPHSKLLFD